MVSFGKYGFGLRLGISQLHKDSEEYNF